MYVPWCKIDNRHSLLFAHDVLQHDLPLLDCALCFISHMNVSMLSGVPEVFCRVADHISLWTEIDVDENTCVTCEDVREACRAVSQELNRILDENEQDEPENSSGSDSTGSPFLLTYKSLFTLRLPHSTQDARPKGNSSH
jgi:Zn ribbon nucleic-acid-binding protein